MLHSTRGQPQITTLRANYLNVIWYAYRPVDGLSAGRPPSLGNHFFSAGRSEGSRHGIAHSNRRFGRESMTLREASKNSYKG
jgi:hypothetical protein